MNSRIYEGWISHRRFRPERNEFRYRVFLLYLDLDEAERLFEPFVLWSSNRPNIAWFRRADHLGDPEKPLGDEVRALVEKETGRRPGGPIRLLTHLRYFGYCMNPVSFYYCWDDDDRALQHVVAEVHNTPWGERHCYVLDCRASAEAQGRFRFRFDKAFHVSPFMPMEQRYAWEFSTPGESLHVRMENFEDAESVFDASMFLRAAPVTSRNLARVLIMYPFMTGKVILAIYWQALRLWLKRIPFHSHPKHHSPQETDR